MKCADFLNELTDYLDGSLDAKLRTELEEHLHWCRNCFVVCNTTKLTIEIYRDHEVYELPDGLRDKLRTAVIDKCKQHNREKA